MSRISTDLGRYLFRICTVFVRNEPRLGAGYDATLCGICTVAQPALEASAAAWYNTGCRKDGGTMDTTSNAAWETMTPEEKRRALYNRQVALLDTFL